MSRLRISSSPVLPKNRGGGCTVTPTIRSKGQRDASRQRYAAPQTGRQTGEMSGRAISTAAGIQACFEDGMRRPGLAARDLAAVDVQDLAGDVGRRLQEQDAA